MSLPEVRKPHSNVINICNNLITKIAAFETVWKPYVVWLVSYTVFTEGQKMFQFLIATAIN